MQKATLSVFDGVIYMLDILYHDSHLAVAVKPAGILSEGETKGTMPHMLASELEALNGTKVTPYTVHRLDKDTCGIMAYALTSKAAAALSAQIQSGDFKKTYTALLCGIPQADEGHLSDLLYYDRQRSKAFVVDRKRGGVKQAELNYRVLEKRGSTTLVEVELLTGRTHQIRVQFASRGLPLFGDRRYGAPPSSGNQLALCATSLSFLHPFHMTPLSFNIPCPDFRVQ